LIGTLVYLFRVYQSCNKSVILMENAKWHEERAMAIN